MNAHTIALFGGSFNPPHVVHGMVCLYLLHTGCAQVWVIPTWRHAFDKALAPFEDRLQMCKELVRPLGDRVQVLDTERQLGGRSYTIDTVRALNAAHPDARFSWVVGSDILDEIDRWKDAQTLKRLVDFRVLYRAGFTCPEGEMSFPQVSSTQIRGRLARGLDVGGLVPLTVLEHIRARGLYAPAGALPVEES